MLASPGCPLLLAASLALSNAVSALPLAPPSSPERRGYSPATPPAQFIDYFPTFTSPSAGDVFQAGGDILISWNATKPNYPDNQLHTYALVVLGYLDSADPGGGYHLDFDHPLGNVSFYSGSGSASLPLPANLTTRSTYLVTMGSTQNISPLFTIEGSADAASSSAATSSAAESATATTSASASASSATAAQIESIAPQPLTVHFPDGSTTVVGGSAAAAATTSTAGAGASIDTSLNDIAAPKTNSEASETSATAAATATASAAATATASAAATATASAAATSGSASQSQVQATPSLAQAGAASSPATSSSPTSGAGSIYLSSRHSLFGLGLATVAAMAMAL